MDKVASVVPMTVPWAFASLFAQFTSRFMKDAHSAGGCFKHKASDDKSAIGRSGFVGLKNVSQRLISSLLPPRWGATAGCDVRFRAPRLRPVAQRLFR